ncbi:MAG: type II toxin-antitoxin system RelE/ParE family toxin [Actinomycetota bacterium]
MAERSWSVEFHPACEIWANGLSRSDGEALLAAIRILRDEGPNLGRPLVDGIKGSRLKNMKELRPGSTGRTEVRVLFAFDMTRRAMLLVGGDKSRDWKVGIARTFQSPIVDSTSIKQQLTKLRNRTGNGRGSGYEFEELGEENTEGTESQVPHCRNRR